MKLLVTYTNGPRVEILGTPNRGNYKVDFVDRNTKQTIHTETITNNMWTKCNREWFTDWDVIVTDKEANKMVEFNKFDPTARRIYVRFETPSLGDTIAWIPYVEEFRKKWKCSMFCATPFNFLFSSFYPDIQFVGLNVQIQNIYAKYDVGYFKNNGVWDGNKHPTDPKPMPLQKITSDILGLPFKEIRPNLEGIPLQKKKQVSIAIHSTAQCKYWNYENGWQVVVDYLRGKGYAVLLLSKEENGYMGNYEPVGITKIPAGSLDELCTHIKKSELFIGISSGLSWVAWAMNVPTVLISGFTPEYLEPTIDVTRIINKEVCHGCWGTHEFDPKDWNWCPINKNSKGRIFECSKLITPTMVIEKLNHILQ